MKISNDKRLFMMITIMIKAAYLDSMTSLVRNINSLLCTL